MKKITKKERAVLCSIVESEYQETGECSVEDECLEENKIINHPIYSWDIYDQLEGHFKGRQVSGIIGSLIKKELVGVCGTGIGWGSRNRLIWITEKGYKIL